MCHQVDAYGGDQSRACSGVLFDGRGNAGAPQHGSVADVWPGERESKPAVVRGDDFARSREYVRATFLRLLLGQWIFAVEVSRCEISLGRRSGALYLESGGDERW